MSESVDTHVEAKLNANSDLVEYERVLPSFFRDKLGYGRLWRSFAARLVKPTRRGGYHVPLSERWLLLVGVDLICQLIAFWMASYLWATQNPMLLQYWVWFPLILIGWWFLAQFTDLYDIPSSSDPLTSVLRLVGCALLTLVVYFAVSLIFPGILPITLLLYFLGFALVLLIAWRLVYANLLYRMFAPHRVLILDVADCRGQIAQLLRLTGRLNYKIVGYVDDDPTLNKQEPADIPLLGSVSELLNLVQEHHIHELVVAQKHALTDELADALFACQGQGVQISWMPDLHEKICRSVPIHFIDNSWALSAIQGRPIFSRLQLIGKRCLDLLIVISALPFLLLAMPLIAIAIFLDSPGPIFYHQVRVGRGGELFTIYKFRTMIPDAEKNSTPQWAADRDPRITRIGRILRKMRLDELPQMLNIFRGEMSFVGPRPERPEFITRLEQKIPFYRTRLLVKPGLTGWAQIHYGYGNSVEDAVHKLQFDFYYIHHWSLWKDIYILFRTIFVVFQFKGN